MVDIWESNSSGDLTIWLVGGFRSPKMPKFTNKKMIYGGFASVSSISHPN